MLLISGFKHATISIRGYFKYLNLPIFRSPCERPRTYDKFYQRNPGNFQPGEQERDSAISVCSSEECDQVTIMMTLTMVARMTSAMTISQPTLDIDKDPW